ncbi:MAG: VWA domain-containing protein [Candidatus Acidiferrales bacterium]
MKKQSYLCCTMAVLAATIALLGEQSRAQSPPGPIKQPAGTNSQADPAKQNGPIRVRVELVSAPVVVRNEKGEIVMDLEQSNFRLFDNGTEQKIDHFDMGSDPLSVVLLVETSTRVAPMLPAIQKSGVIFTQNILGEFDEGAVIAFGSFVNRLQDFTSDRDKLDKVIENLQDGGSQTKLYDAMAAAVRMLAQRAPDRRRVIVAITEAADRGSASKLGGVLQQAQLENITIFTVGLSTTAAEFRTQPQGTTTPSATPPGIITEPPIPHYPQSPTTPGLGEQPTGDLLAVGIWAIEHGANLLRGHALEVATIATGGEHIATMRDKGIEAGLDKIGGELHAQYTLSYHPTGTSPYGYHEIRVEVDRPKTTVRTRPGYYLPQDVPPGN